MSVVIHRSVLLLAAALPSVALANPVTPTELVNGAQGMCLDAAGNDGRIGANVALWTCDAGNDQRWTLTPQGQLVNGGQQRCLGTKGAARKKGTNVELMACSGAGHLFWDVAPVAGGFIVRHRATGQCLDIKGKAGARGDNAQIWDCDGGVDQTFSWRGAAANPNPNAPPPPMWAVLEGSGLCLDTVERGRRGVVALAGRACEPGGGQRWRWTERAELVLEESGECLTVDPRNGQRIVADDCRGTPEQQWEHFDQRGRASIRSRSTGQCITFDRYDGRGSQPGHLEPCAVLDSQFVTWSLQPPASQLPPGVPPPNAPPPAPPVTQAMPAMLLVNQAQGLCLDAAGFDGRLGANVGLFHCDGGRDQSWIFTARGELQNAQSGACLDPDAADGAAGRNVVLGRCNDMADQRWEVVQSGPRFTLRNAVSGMCLDVAGFAGNPNDNVGLYRCDGYADQSFVWGVPVNVAQAPVPMPPPPPAPLPAPPAGPYVMDDAQFDRLVAAVKSEPFTAGKMQVWEIGVRTEWITCAQLARAVPAFTFPKDQLAAIRFVAPRVVDKQNREDVVRALTFDTDRRAAREALK